MQNTVDYIRKIEMVDANDIASFLIIPENKVRITMSVEPKEIPIVGLAQLEISEKVENKVIISTIKLTASICNDIDLTNRKLIFKLTSTSGIVYIIGRNFRPYPIVTNSSTRPSSTSTAFKKQLLITYSAVDIALLELI